MTESSHGTPATLELTREEAWVAHAGLLTVLERENEDESEADRACSVLQELEGDREFGEAELQFLRNALIEYLADAPLRDRAPCRSVISSVRTALH